MSPQVQNLASSIISDPRFVELKVAAYEAVSGWEYIDASNAYGNYMGVKRLFDNLQEWAKEGNAEKLKDASAKAGELPPSHQDPDLV